MKKVEVERFSIPDRLTGQPSGDYMRVGGRVFETKILGDLEFKRCEREHPENPAFNMRPMFRTGSPFGKEILELVDGS